MPAAVDARLVRKRTSALQERFVATRRRMLLAWEETEHLLDFARQTRLASELLRLLKQRSTGK